MRNMFQNADVFNKDISSWDVSSVTDMSWMFDGATAFNGNIGAWKVSNVTTMDSMFYDAATFNHDLSSWCVTQVLTHVDFDTGTTSSWTRDRPVWGTCP